MSLFPRLSLRTADGLNGFIDLFIERVGGFIDGCSVMNWLMDFIMGSKLIYELVNKLIGGLVNKLIDKLIDKFVCELIHVANPLYNT